MLPPSCERFIKLLEQAARLHPTVSDKQHPIGLCLASELQATNHSLLTTMIVLEPLCLISLTGMPECLSALMRVAPPSDEWKAKAIQELEQRAMALKMPGVDTTDGLLPNAVETRARAIEELAAAAAAAGGGGGAGRNCRRCAAARMNE